MSEHKIPIPGRIYNASGGNVCGADDIIDDVKGKKQSQINTEVDERTSTLEQNVGPGGSVDERINNAKTSIIGDAGSDYNTLGKLEDKIQEETATRLDEHYLKTETYNKNELNNLITTPNQEYVTVVATDQITAATDVLPATGSADTIYRVGNWDGSQYDESLYTEYAWNGSAYVPISVKSQIGEVYDISLNHAGATYADLAAALGTNGANIPVSLRKGGMSVKFVQSSDNNYIQARCMAQNFTTDTTQWAFCGDDVYKESTEFVEVKTDNSGKLLEGRKLNGNKVEFNNYEIRGEIINKDLENKFESKVDKEEGKSLINEDFASSQGSNESTEWLEVTNDKDGRMLSGRRKDGGIKEFVSIETPQLKAEEAILGNTTFTGDIPEQIKDYVDNNPELKKAPNDYLLLSKQADNLIDVIGFSSFVGKTFVVVSPDRYSSWPFIGKLGNKLICLYSVGEQHEAQEGAIWVTESANGVIWTPKRLIIDDTTIRDNVTGIGNDSNGNILFWNRVGFASAGTHYDLYRTSDGYSFERISQPVFDVIVQPTSIFTVPTQGLFSFYHVYGSSRSWGYLKSSDNGLTWTKQVIESGLAEEECPTEIYGVYLGDGKILAVGRYEGSGTGKLWQVQSNDYGTTWTKKATNISNNSHTPSIIYDETEEKISLYIYNRSNGTLEYRETDVTDIWDNPTNWPSATAIATGAGGQNAGNVTTCVFNGKQIASWYSGNSQDTGIYCIIN